MENNQSNFKTQPSKSYPLFTAMSSIICLIFSFLTLSLLISCVKQKNNRKPPLVEQNKTLETNFGKPTRMMMLQYKKLYYKKPFPYAIIFYYSNGVYKIISPGENHYGLYLMEGNKEKEYQIRYMSIPSSDWNDNVAYHHLRFDCSKGIFQQQAITDADKNINPQWGYFWEKENSFDNPTELQWSDDFVAHLGFPKYRKE